MPRPFDPYKLQFVASLMNFTRNLSFASFSFLFCFFLLYLKKENFHFPMFIVVLTSFLFSILKFDIQSNWQIRYANSMVTQIRTFGSRNKKKTRSLYCYGNVSAQWCPKGAIIFLFSTKMEKQQCWHIFLIQTIKCAHNEHYDQQRNGAKKKVKTKKIRPSENMICWKVNVYYWSIW